MTDAILPANEAEVAEAIADAAVRKEPLQILGNGTKSAMLRPVQAARSLSTRKLSGITLYSPKELIISVRAGTPLEEIRSTLAEHGQHIIAEPPSLFGSPDRQTIGGVIAANLSGPRRVAWGAMRDHLLGIRAVTGRGDLIHSGGRVLKNVTGLDFCKLFAGSHGTLGVITEITLKVLPAPESVATVVLPGLDATAGVAALSAALGSPYGPSGAAWLPRQAAAHVPVLARFDADIALVRIEDFAASVQYRTIRLRDDLRNATAEILDASASQMAWQAVRDLMILPVTSEEALWRVSVRPSAGPSIVRSVADAFGASCFLDWGGGLVWIAGPATAAAHGFVERAVRAAGGTWTLFRSPEPLRVAVDVLPPEPEPLARISRRVKAAFDPQSILNPGRMYAGI